MELSGKVEYDMEIKSPGKVFIELFGSKKENLPKICSIVPRIDLLEGKWGEVGSLIDAYYLIDGKQTSSKEMVVAVDENKSIAYSIHECELTKLYKKIKFTFQIISDNINNSETLKITLEYEKGNEDVPYPDGLMNFAIAVSKIIEAHHCTPATN